MFSSLFSNLVSKRTLILIGITAVGTFIFYELLYIAEIIEQHWDFFDLNEFASLLFAILFIGSAHAVINSYEYSKSFEKLQDTFDINKHIIDNTANMFVWLSPEGTVLKVNQAFCDVSGYSLDELLGQNWWSLFFPDGERDPDIQRLNEVTENGRMNAQNVTMVLRCKSGAQRDISWATMNRYDESGRIVDLIVLGFDLTQEREKARIETQREKMATVGELAAGISHEIGNALQPVLSLSEIIRNKAQTADPKLGEYARVIHDSALYIRNIIESILNLSRDRASNAEVYKYNDLVEDTVSSLKETVPGGINIDTTELILGENISVYIDQTHFQQVLSNLLKNAWQAMNESGVIVLETRLQLHDKSAEEVPSVLQSGLYVRLSVTDTGSGMEQHIADQVFNPFFTTKPTGEGTGLGMAIVQRMVRDWRGDIFFETELGKGTTFNVYMPVYKEENDDLSLDGLL